MNAPPNTERSLRFLGITRKALVCLAVPLFIVVSIVGYRLVVKRKYDRARTEWKATTLHQLAGLSITNEEISKELESLKSAFISDGYRVWTSDHLLVMTNGEFLIYAFRHGFNNGFVDHLFLSHASDGRWLYSTYHFCNGMAGVLADDPPGSIVEFETRYSAREFDGKSDECLKRTWPLNNP